MTAKGNTIGVLLEWHGKNLTEAAAETLAEANKLAAELQCRVAAFGAAAGLDEAALAALPVEKLYFCNRITMSQDLATAAAGMKEDIALLLTPMTLQGREFAACYSLEKNWELVSGCSGILVQEGNLALTRLTAEGLTQESKAFPLAELPGLVLGMVPGVWGGTLEYNGKAQVVPLTVEQCHGAAIVKEYLADWQEIGVSEADMVVAGGGGMGSREDFATLYQLGEALAAPVGGSRVAEDKGWVTHQAMIGATGQTIAPEVYMAWGISGAIQHIIGIQNCKRVIAVNTDPMCPLMTNADLAVVAEGPATAVALAEKLKAYRPKKEV